MQTDALLPGILIYETDPQGLITQATSTGDPSVTATTSGRFAVGGQIVDSTVGKLYSNVGTSASPSWNSTSDIAPSEITLAQDSILVGAATGLAAAKAMSGDIAITSTGATTIQANAVTTSKIADGNVTDAKVATISDSKAIYTVKNDTGGDLAPGILVDVIVSAAGEPVIILADSSTNVPAKYVITNGGVNIVNGTYGTVAPSATYGSIDTSTAAAKGSPMYLSTAGGYVFDTPPAGADVLTQVVGYVTAKNVNGSVLLKPAVVTAYGTSFLKASAVTAAKIGASFALSGAPSFTGGSDTTSSTGAGTPSGSIDQATFTGNALGTHTHVVELNIGEVENSNNKKLYTGAITGTPVVGATLLQAGSAATAIVTAHYGSGIPDFNLQVTVTFGTFDATNVVTGTNPDLSTYTFTPTMTLVDSWALGNAPAGFIGIESNSGVVLPLTTRARVLTAGVVRLVKYLAVYYLETLSSDGWTSIAVDYSLATTTAVGAGTPAGSINAQNFTGSALGTHSHTVTPTGSNSTPSIQVS